ncbi:MAG: HPr family phosphocarrier protein [Selenomonadaceae bacterium]|nr:HPr family phosphocarrier protein [Selenomonadaceae bacterium]
MKDSTRDKNGYSETETGGSVYVKHCSIFVQKANSFKSKVQIKARGKIVDAKSILMIMSLGLVKGVEITIIAEGEDAKEAVESLKALVDSNFGEE